MNKLTLPTLTFFAIMIFGCGNAQNAQTQSGIIEVSSEELVSLQAKGTKVIDVRTIEEVSQGRIPGAIHIQLDDNMVSNMGAIGKEAPVIVYCRSGARSTKAAELMVNSGYKTVYNYKGSMNDWLSKGKPVE